MTILSSSLSQSSRVNRPSPHLNKPQKNNEMLSNDSIDEISPKCESGMSETPFQFPPLAYYALKSLFSAIDVSLQASYLSRNEILPNLGAMPRIPFPAQLYTLLYPRLTTVGTSPIHWALICRLFTGLPRELETFHMAFEESLFVPLQRWCASGITSSSNEMKFLTTVSIGRPGTDASIPPLSKIRSLMALDLSCSSITAKGIEHMSVLCGIRHDSMDGERLLSRLRVLMLARCRLGPHTKIEELLRKLKMLQYIGG